METFLEKYLETWNGEEHRDHILTLVSVVRIQPFAG